MPGDDLFEPLTQRACQSFDFFHRRGSRFINDAINPHPDRWLIVPKRINVTDKFFYFEGFTDLTVRVANRQVGVESGAAFRCFRDLLSSDEEKFAGFEERIFAASAMTVLIGLYPPADFVGSSRLRRQGVVWLVRPRRYSEGSEATFKDVVGC